MHKTEREGRRDPSSLRLCGVMLRFHKRWRRRLTILKRHDVRRSQHSGYCTVRTGTVLERWP